MALDRKYPDRAYGQKKVSLADEFAPEAPPVSVNIYRRPWDTPAMLANRGEMAANLALSILDVDVNERASLYTQLPDDVLSAYQKASERLHMFRHQCLKLLLTSVPTVGIATTIGLTSGFNTVTLIAEAAGVAGMAASIIKFRTGEKAREALVDIVDRDLKDREITPATRPAAFSYRDRSLALKN